jgi:hypothetical protein
VNNGVCVDLCLPTVLHVVLKCTTAFTCTIRDVTFFIYVLVVRHRATIPQGYSLFSWRSWLEPLTWLRRGSATMIAASTCSG